MDRRTFLKATGGIAASTALSPEILEAAASQIKHIVVVMMENRSFDHFLGWLPSSNGMQAGLAYQDVNEVRTDDELGSFRRLERVARQRGWPVYQ